MKQVGLPGALTRNWPGLLSILLAIASVAAYWLATVVASNPRDLGKLDSDLISVFQLGSATSALVGFLAVLRARRGAGGLASGITGLVLGGTLTILWAAWFAMLMVFNPPGLGG